MIKAGRHFDWGEFQCHGEHCCGHTMIAHPNLILGLDALREIADEPIIVVSGFRCITHNIEVGGAKHSYHTYGMAADIKTKGIEPKYLAAMATEINVFGEGGIGIYDNWIHVDVRLDPPARWDKRKIK